MDRFADQLYLHLFGLGSPSQVHTGEGNGRWYIIVQDEEALNRPALVWNSADQVWLWGRYAQPTWQTYPDLTGDATPEQVANYYVDNLR